MPLSRLTTNSFTPYGISLPAIATTSPTAQLNGMKNLLINGDFRIWQLGTDLNPVSTGNGVTGVDRWTNQYCDFTARLRKVEDTINGETVDTAEITKNSGSYGSCEFTQKVETNTSKYLRGQTVTFSFWIKKIGETLGSHQYDCWIGDSETVDDTGWTNQRTIDRGRHTRPAGMTSATVFTSTGVWQKIKITRTLSADTNTIYCTIYTSNTPVGEGIRVAKCQLEIGSVDTDFERRPYQTDLNVALRYREGVYATGPGGDKDVALGSFNGNTAFQGAIFWKVQKRSVPSVALVAASNFYVHIPGAFRVSMSTLSVTDPHEFGTHLAGTCGSSGSSGQGCFIAMNTAYTTTPAIMANSEF